MTILWDHLRPFPAEELSSRPERSHRIRNSDSQPVKTADQSAFGNRDGGKQKLPALGILFGEDVMTVIEIVEELSQLESMPGQVCRFGGCNALLQQ